MFHIKVLPNQVEFTQMGAEDLLEAALNAGFSVNYGCAAGNCGLCKARLTEGRIEKTRFHDYVLPEAEKQRGFFLMCAHKALSDLTVEVPLASQASDIAAQSIKTRVKKIAPLQMAPGSPDVLLLQLQTPRTQTLRFLAGQTVTLRSGGDKPIELAVASCPCDERNLQFHMIRGDVRFDAFMAGLKVNGVVELHGPHGDFTLESYCERPSVFIAYETGFAPVRSLIEHSMSLGMECRIELHLLHSGDQHYSHNLCRSWQDAFDHFHFRHYQAAQSPPPEIVQHLLFTYPGLSGVHVYVAGPAWLTRGIAESIAAAGLPGDNIKYFETETAEMLVP